MCLSVEYVCMDMMYLYTSSNTVHGTSLWKKISSSCKLFWRSTKWAMKNERANLHTLCGGILISSLLLLWLKSLQFTKQVISSIINDFYDNCLIYLLFYYNLSYYKTCLMMTWVIFFWTEILITTYVTPPETISHFATECVQPCSSTEEILPNETMPAKVKVLVVMYRISKTQVLEWTMCWL